MRLLRECANQQMDRNAPETQRWCRDPEVEHGKEGLRPGNGKAGIAHLAGAAERRREGMQQRQYVKHDDG